MATLKPHAPVVVPCSNSLVGDYQACGLNSVITYLEWAGEIGKVDVEKLKQVLDYDEEGISDQKTRWRKLNTELRKWKVPYSFNWRKYTSHQDLLEAVQKQGPVPVFFWMSVLHFTKDHYKDLGYQQQFGDVFDARTHHVLILTGVDAKNELLFIDPSYQLPFLTGQPKDTSKYYFPLPKLDFYQSVTRLKAFLEVTKEVHLEKRYKKELKQNRNQTRLLK